MIYCWRFLQKSIENLRLNVNIQIKLCSWLIDNNQSLSILIKQIGRCGVVIFFAAGFYDAMHFKWPLIAELDER